MRKKKRMTFGDTAHAIKNIIVQNITANNATNINL